MPGAGRLLDDLLVAALHGAVALAEVDGGLVLVGQHLDLDVARVLEELLEVDGGVAEGVLRLGARGVHRVHERGLGVHDAHAAPAAAAGGLDDDGVADQRREAPDLLGVVGQRPVGAGHAGDAHALHRRLGRDLVAHHADRGGRRADEDEAGVLHALGEVGVLGEEAVAGVDRLRVGDLGGADDGRDVEVAVARGRRADAHRLVGEHHVLRVRVGLRMDGDRLDAHFAAGALDAQRDLAAVGDEDLLEHLGCRGRHYSITKSGWPYSTGWPFSTRIAFTVPAASDSISFRSFIASMMQSVWPLVTVCPTSTKAGAPGEGER